MGGFHQDIADALASVADVAGVDVIYRRGASWIKLARVVPGESTFRVDDGFGAIVKVRSRDYLIPAANLKLDGAQVTPQRGDTIEEIVGNAVHVHEALRPDGDGDVWRYSDQGRSRIRVHTKLKEIRPR
jgi:hypothetical protein